MALRFREEMGWRRVATGGGAVCMYLGLHERFRRIQRAMADVRYGGEPAKPRERLNTQARRPRRRAPAALAGPAAALAPVDRRAGDRARPRSCSSTSAADATSPPTTPMCRRRAWTSAPTRRGGWSNSMSTTTSGSSGRPAAVPARSASLPDRRPRRRRPSSARPATPSPANRPTVGQRKAELTAAQSTLDYQTKELARQKVLTGAGVGSQPPSSTAQQHNVDAAKAQLEASQTSAGLRARDAGRQPAPPTPPPTRRCSQAQAALDRAKLTQSYGATYAAQAGIGDQGRSASGRRLRSPPASPCSPSSPTGCGSRPISRKTSSPICGSARARPSRSTPIPA